MQWAGEGLKGDDTQRWDTVSTQSVPNRTLCPSVVPTVIPFSLPSNPSSIINQPLSQSISIIIQSNQSPYQTHIIQFVSRTTLPGLKWMRWSGTLFPSFNVRWSVKHWNFLHDHRPMISSPVIRRCHSSFGTWNFEMLVSQGYEKTITMRKQ